MAILASTVIDTTKSMLNDPIGSIYPDQALYPFLNQAYKELQKKLGALGVSTTKEESTPITVLQGTIVLVDGGGLPPDFILPIQLKERLNGSSDYYSDMTPREWEPDEKPGVALSIWAFREESIRFIGATTDRQILLRYVKSLPLLQATSPIQINDSDIWLAQRTAALAALLIGANSSRSKALMDDLNSSNGTWDDLRATRVKPMQNIPVRRRRTRWRVG